MKRSLLGYALAFVGFFALQSSALTFAEPGVDFSINISEPVLQISVPPSASITLNPASSSGMFGSTNVTINVATNNMTGYTLSMSVPDTDLVHTTITGENAPVIPTLSSSVLESSFPANAWGYKVTGDSYNPVLINNTPASWVTNTTTNGTDHVMTLAAKVDGTKQAGEYKNTLTFQATANPVPYNILFDKNTEDEVTNLPSTQSATLYNEITLTKTRPERAGWGFFGWCTEVPVGATCQGTKYNPGARFTVSSGNSQTLYAIWGTYAELDTGQNINAKMKSLAAGTEKGYQDTTSDIKAIKRSSELPSGFTPSTDNTISLQTSTHAPVYIWYDNTNNEGILYYYSTVDRIRMNADSACVFLYNSALSDISGLADWDSSNVISLRYAFFGNSFSSTSALAGWDTSNVTNMYGLFATNASLSDISALSGWDTSNVTNLAGILSYNALLSDISALAKWNTSNVTNMYGMFWNDASLSDISALAKWNTSNVTNMSYMFSNDLSLSDISALAGWNTSNVTNMSSMFADNLSLSDISALSKWNTSNVVNLDFFLGLNPGKSKTGNPIIDLTPLSGWNVGNVTTMYCIMQNVNIASYEPLSGWDVSKVENFRNAFNQTSYSTVTSLHGLENWDVHSATNMNSMFADNASLSDASAINDWNISSVTDFGQMFDRTPVHPEFTVRTGTWDTNGTFTPDS